MIEGSRLAAKDKKKPAQMLILIIEDYTLGIVNSLLSMSDLTSNGVFAIEKLELVRKPFPSAHAIYFLEPTEKNLDKMEADFVQKTYAYAHCYFTKVIPEKAMQYFKTKKHLLSKLLSLKELNIDFEVADDSTFSLGLPGLLNHLYYQDPKDHRIVGHLSEKLYCALSILMPCANLEIFHQRSDNCNSVAHYIANKFQAACKRPDSPVQEESGSIKLLLLERSYDPGVPLVHDFNY